MSLANNIIVITEKNEDYNDFRIICRSGLLRDIDNIIHVNYEQGLDFTKKYLPDAIVMYINNSISSALNICKNLKIDNFFKNIPILFILKNKNDEIILSAFDEGITDFIFQPASDTEILIRLMWCLKKNENLRELEKKETLLRSTGIIDKSTEAFAAQYTEKAFITEINTAKKYKYPAVFMVLGIDSENFNRLNSDYLAVTAKNSVRTRDLIGHGDRGKIYLFLPKTTIKGACTVYEKVLKNLKNGLTISGGICEFNPEISYKELEDNALKALNEAVSRGGRRVIIAEPKTCQSKPSDGWLDRIQHNKKEYEHCREHLSFIFKTVVEPVFLELKTKLDNSYTDYLKGEYYITDSKCVFEINKIYESDGVSINIFDSGNAKATIEIFDLKDKTPLFERLIFSPDELKREKLNILIKKTLEKINLKTLI